jgi:uncharacterized membrane protein YjjB (DUF3815 family)
MAQADWSIMIGVLVFLIALVFAIFFYLKYKKLFLLAFTASISTYIFAVFYTWDVFELGRNSILLILVLSTLLMFVMGKYFSKLELKPDKMHTSLKEKK